MITTKNKILINPTYRCQLACSYCQYHVSMREYPKAGYRQIDAFKGMSRIERELSADEWLTHLGKLRPYQLELSGGEPTIYHDIVNLINGIPEDCVWAMTSNTLRPDVIRKLSFAQCISWTSSYHHTTTDKFNQGVEAVRGKWGRYPAVTLVVTEKNMEQSRRMIEAFLSRGFPVNVHPYFGENFEWRKSAELAGFVNTLSGRVNFIDNDWVNDVRFAVCRAGHNYFYMMPDGRVLRCYSHGFAGKVVGHVSDFIPSRGLEPCDVDCRFPCDREIAKSPQALRATEPILV